MSAPATLAAVPVPDPDSAGWWEALSHGALSMCRCTECHRFMQVPQERCRLCAGPTTFEQVSGTGTIFSFIVVRHQSIPSLTPPYVVALVELDEQPGLRLSGIVEADPLDLAIGERVRAVIRPIGESSFAAPSFEVVP